jgi:hypothetical protein
MALDMAHMTKGEVLRYAIAFALRRSRKIVRGLKEGLTEDERYAVAAHTVAQLKERGDPWRLNDEAPTAKPPSTRIGRKAPPDTPTSPSVLKPRSPPAGAYLFAFGGWASARVTNSRNAVVGSHPRLSSLSVTLIVLIRVCDARFRGLRWVCLGTRLFFLTKPLWQVI